MTDNSGFPRETRSGLALIGYRGSGKSTVGKLIAERLNRPFVDSDREIEARSGRSIAAIFAAEGEASFRNLEEDTIAALVSAFPGAVLATGGGAVLREANRRRIRDFGFVAWLQADPDELARRLEADRRSLESRPPLSSAGTLTEIEHVLAERIPLYHQTADAIIDTQDKAPESIAAELIGRWRVGSRLRESQTDARRPPCS
jgi:shikimate kinase